MQIRKFGMLWDFRASVPKVLGFEVGLYTLQLARACRIPQFRCNYRAFQNSDRITGPASVFLHDQAVGTCIVSKILCGVENCSGSEWPKKIPARNPEPFKIRPVYPGFRQE